LNNDSYESILQNIHTDITTNHVTANFTPNVKPPPDISEDENQLSRAVEFDWLNSALNGASSSRVTKHE
jgi:hypothetical protein